MVKVLAVAALLFVGFAQAQHVYKCTGPSGSVSYQSEPCEASQRVDRIYHAEPDTAADEARARRELQRRAAEAKALSRLAGTDRPPRRVYSWREPSARDRQRVVCQAAKDSRESTLRAVGLSRTIDLLRQLDDQVREACKGL